MKNKSVKSTIRKQINKHTNKVVKSIPLTMEYIRVAISQGLALRLRFLHHISGSQE